jgi:hypothetical protein
MRIGSPGMEVLESPDETYEVAGFVERGEGPTRATRGAQPATLIYLKDRNPTFRHSFRYS